MQVAHAPAPVALRIAGRVEACFGAEPEPSEVRWIDLSPQGVRLVEFYESQMLAKTYLNIEQNGQKKR